MTRLFDNIKLFNLLKVPVRFKHPPHHWSVLQKKKSHSQRALDHFDDFYKNVYGQSWSNIRSALLAKNHKYIAVVNNFSDTTRICQDLETLGAMNMKLIYDASKKNQAIQQELKKKKKVLKEIKRIDQQLDHIVSETKSKYSIYPKSYEIDAQVVEKTTFDDNKSFKPVKLQSIETDLNIVNDSSRIIMPSSGITAEQLYEYIPATEIKGMDDFILESEHYGHYSKGADFVIQIEEDHTLNFPDQLLIYTFEESNDMIFPKSKTGTTKVSDYFILDGASILPVLSLDLKPGDRLLDMCAAPGGKLMIALQSLIPEIIVANDVQQSRINRINYFINEFLGTMNFWDKRFLITQNDGRYIEDKDIYNKILVDVPCTTDRHVLHEDDNNLFKASRIKERLKLPELQTELLKNALKLVKVGGTVVYSTCTLSPIQNDGIVRMALKKSFEESQVVHVVKDQTRALDPLRYLYNFGNYGLKYGHIVIPSKSRNFGPMYFCKIIRVK
ncbi:5-methylcytosine rRNA methyltransferase NSUN4 [Phymastichus coffea]|uniref:5-methylcytosine rRNA methyltransferase NSUN4 n=1 Tax=Phymastichus coffea TaxID=108790 RepID=UPI00273B8A01|nr:5-methylcytosine rRNA methyltransferase NSUN4 [Phymastichus coffea]